MSERHPERTCPRCGHTWSTRFERCPECGTNAYVAPRAVRRRRLLVGAVLLVLLGAGAATVAVLAAQDRRDREAHARVEQDRLVDGLRQRLVRIQAPHRGAATGLRPRAGATPAERLAARRALVGAVEASILADARARARAGELDGPIRDAACGPLERSKQAVPDDRDLTKPVGRYDCIAAKSDVIRGDGVKVATLGHPFVAALDFRRYTYVWCRNQPAQGEAGRSLVFVRLQRACLAATGKVLGTGYADVPLP